MAEGKQKDNRSALRVMGGIEQPSSVSDDAVNKLRSRRQNEPLLDDYIDGILAGDRIILSKAITLVESNLARHQALAQSIIGRCLPHSSGSIRIGITGVPGAGKSTFIESFGCYLTSLGRKVAVLAVDPSSERSKGSILGDKTRMEKLSQDRNAYIRPSPAGGSLGGVSRKTRETIILAEAAGFNTILVETVGVGQSETAVHGMVDFFLLLMIAGAGDELQGIKRGIMEMSDAVIINKADGDNKDKAKLAEVQYAGALHFFPKSESGWAARTGTCSALTGEGIDKVWDIIQEYISLAKTGGYFEKRRNEQSVLSMRNSILENIKESFYGHPHISCKLKEMEGDVLESKLSPYLAASILTEMWLKELEGRNSESG